MTPQLIKPVNTYVTCFGDFTWNIEDCFPVLFFSWCIRVFTAMALNAFKCLEEANIFVDQLLKTND
jgi:hypothetical protein